MHIGSVLLIIWLIIGAIAAGHRGDYKHPVDCSNVASTAGDDRGGPPQLLWRESAHRLQHPAAEQIAGKSYSLFGR